MGAGHERQTRARESGTRARWGGALGSGGGTTAPEGAGSELEWVECGAGKCERRGPGARGRPERVGVEMEYGSAGAGPRREGWAAGARRRDLGTEWAGPMLRLPVTPRLPWVLQLLGGWGE